MSFTDVLLNGQQQHGCYLRPRWTTNVQQQQKLAKFCERKLFIDEFDCAQLNICILTGQVKEVKLTASINS